MPDIFRLTTQYGAMVAATLPMPGGDDYDTQLLALGNGASFCYFLESGATSAEQSGSGAGVLTYGGSPSYVGPAATGSSGGMRFDGSTSYGSASDHAGFDFGTSDFWFHVLINIDNAGWATSDSEFAAHDGNNGNGSWGFVAASVDGTPRTRTQFVDTSANTVDDTIYLDSTPGTGWHQLLWTVDRDSATGITLYLDGVAQADTGNPTAAQGAIDSAGTFYVARRETNRYLAMDLALVAGGTGLPSSAAVGALWAVI